jgi:hypothetical protein
VLRAFPSDFVDLVVTSPPYSDKRKKSYGGTDPEERAALINRFTAEFSSEFCAAGRINWEKLVVFNSGNLETKK